MNVQQVEELKRIILHHVTPEEHGDRALQLLKTIEQRRCSSFPGPSAGRLLYQCLLRLL